MKRRLHLLLSADPLDDCLRLASAGDQLLLMDQAVSLLADAGFLQALPRTLSVVVSSADRAARALPLPTVIKELDDRQVVRLIAGCEQLVSWP